MISKDPIHGVGPTLPTKHAFAPAHRRAPPRRCEPRSTCVRGPLRLPEPSKRNTAIFPILPSWTARPVLEPATGPVPPFACNHCARCPDRAPHHPVSGHAQTYSHIPLPAKAAFRAFPCETTTRAPPLPRHIFGRHICHFSLHNLSQTTLPTCLIAQRFTQNWACPLRGVLNGDERHDEG